MEKCYGVAFLSSNYDHANTFIFGVYDDELRAHAFYQFILKKFHKVMSDFYRELDDSWAMPFDYGSTIEQYYMRENKQFIEIYRTIAAKYRRLYFDVMPYLTSDERQDSWMAILDANGQYEFKLFTLNKI